MPLAQAGQREAAPLKRLDLPDDFFEPLPGDLPAAFEGGGEAA